MTYVPGNGANKTTGLIATYQNGSDAAYSYTYDDVGNITSITQGTTSIGYVYDEANRLIRENNSILNQTIIYEYDTWGNILNKKGYAYTTATNPGTPTSTIAYNYGNGTWKDQLTEYNGQTIAYDEMGNPTSYRGYTFGWRGKQLTSASNGTNSLTFAYNEDGLRQKKVCNNISTDYYYNGSVLIGMQRGTSKFLFSYDAAGNVVSVKYITANSTNEYYYLRNAQNDVVKLIDANGTPVVEYTYDTWGKKVTTTGTLAGTLGLFQPFRYRGYVYDWETGFYYLQSRYYDPTTGRFISADVLLSTGQGVLGHNCYAYCLGNPVNYEDAQGEKTIDNTWTETYTGKETAIKGLVRKPDKYYLPNFISTESTIALQMYGYISIESKDTKDNSKRGIIIYLYNNENIKEWVDILGEERVAQVFMTTAKRKYKNTTGLDFPQTDNGMKKEIRDHIGGYFHSKGWRKYSPFNVWIAMKIGRIKNEEESCGKINLDPDSSRIERFIYGYTD